MAIRKIRLGTQSPHYSARPRGILLLPVETRTLKAKNSVRACPIVFPGDGAAQFHQLRCGEALAQPLTEFICHLGRRGGHGIRQFQNQFLVGIKQIAFTVPVKVADLFITQACRLTCGRIDVDSKRTLNQFGRANLSQYFQLSIYQIDLLECLAELRIGDHEVRMGSHILEGAMSLPRCLRTNLRMIFTLSFLNIHTSPVIFAHSGNENYTRS